MIEINKNNQKKTQNTLKNLASLAWAKTLEIFIILL